MLFNSYAFVLLFLPLGLLGFYLLGRLCRDIRVSRAFLLLLSLVFYASHDLRFVPILLGSALLNHLLAQTLQYPLCS